MKIGHISPPHTAVQVLGERVANGFTLEIHDRGLGMAADALLDANLRLAETPEFELSDTDRLGLFVVSRLAQRQNVRVSLQPSPYGGTTAVVFIPDALLTDDVPDTNGIGFRLDRPRPSKEAELEEAQRVSLTRGPAQLAGRSPAILDGPVELEAPVDLDALNDFPGVLDSEDSERGGLFRPRRSLAQVDDEAPGTDGADIGDGGPDAPVSLSRRRTPKLVTSHGRPVTDERTGREETDEPPAIGPGASRPATPAAGQGPARSEPPTLPSRRRAAALRRGTGVADRLDELTETPTSSASPSREPGGPSGAPVLPRRTRRAEIASSGTGPDSGDSATGATGRPDAPALGPVAPAPGALGRGGPADSAPDGVVRPGWGESARGASGASGAGRPPLGAARGSQDGAPGTAPLPRRVRQANLAPQLKQAPERRPQNQAEPAERDADEVRSRMASLQRGWQRGREENAVGDDLPGGTAPQRTTKGDGR